MAIMQSMRWAGALALAATTLAAAGELTVVQVKAPDVVCVFQTSCSVTVADSTADIPLNYSAGTPFLQSRTFTGAPGTPAAGLTGYEYRVDMRSAGGAVDCLLGLVVDFGPVAALPYKAGTKADVYVITQGGLGSVGVKSAEQTGSVIEFTFDKPMCVGPKASSGESTFFFGLASAKPPHAITAGMWGHGTPAYISLDARAPEH
jgi:hypothetical protein